jgi:hypothetical protein
MVQLVAITVVVQPVVATVMKVLGVGQPISEQALSLLTES